MEKKLNEELETVSSMIVLYCSRKHLSEKLCKECLELQEYAADRIGKCKFAERKPVCRNCTSHCYKPQMREKIRDVMRFAGPRMIYCHPVAAVKHLIKSFRG
jgi:hypothetical protein